MSNAFRCDGCRDFHSGEPAFEAKVKGKTFIKPGDGDVFRPTHNGGVQDYNPVGNVDIELEWPKGLLQSHTIELCGWCYAEEVHPAIKSVVHEKEERND
jgi:hypothetical protein